MDETLCRRSVPNRAWRAALAAAAASPALLLGAGCAAVPYSSAALSSAGPAELADRLPAMAAGFQRGGTRPVGAGGGAAQGREAAYSTGGGRSATAAATVELLSDGAGAEAALDAALAEVLRAGPARQMREAGRFTVAAAAGGPGGGAGGSASALLCAETAGRYGREYVAGLVCAGRVGGALLRIRVTMPARQPPPADPRAFAEAIAANLSGSPVPAAAAARPG